MSVIETNIEIPADVGGVKGHGVRGRPRIL